MGFQNSLWTVSLSSLVILAASVFEILCEKNRRTNMQTQILCSVRAQGHPPYPYTNLSSTLSFSTFFFSLSYSRHLFSYFFIPSHSTRIVSLGFQVGCRRRRLNLALVFCACWFCVICISQLSMHACFCRIWFSFVLQCDSCIPLL